MNSATPAAEAPDTYFKKRITYTSREESFVFDLGHTIFSSFQVDEGTDLLLRLLDVDVPPRTILDLGCGYGVIGIVLARRFPEARVVLADKDLLAVRYARANCALNGIHNAQVLGSVGMDDVPDMQYDLIVSNIPAKIGDAAIEHEFIMKPLAHLRPGGVFWYVVVSGLNRLMPTLGTRHRLGQKAVKKRAGHTVYRIIKPELATREQPEEKQP